MSGPIALDATGTVFVPTFAVTFRSRDRGDNWEMAGQLPMAPDDDVPVQLEELVITGAGHLVGISPRHGLYRSTNYGRSWSNVLSSMFVQCVAVSADDVLCAGGVAFQVSSDGGATWNPADPGFDDYVSCISADSGGAFFAGSNERVLRSVDGGNTWEVHRVGVQVLCIAVDTDNRIYAGGDHGVAVSGDDGNTWVTHEVASGTYGVTSLATSPDGTVFAGVYGYGAFASEVYRSDDHGVTWAATNGPFGDGPVSWLEVGPDGAVYAGMELGLYRSDDRGGSWSLVGMPTSWIGKVFRTTSGKVLAGTIESLWDPWGRLFEMSSPSGGWEQRDTWDVAALSFAENSKGDLFVGTTAGMMVSTDDGVSWSPGTFPLSATAMETVDGTMWVGTFDVEDFPFAGIYSSADDGFTWIPTGNITLPVRDLAFGYAVATTEGVMTDYGLMIQGTEANCLAIAEGDIIIAGTDDGVYRSADWGKSFERTGFPGRSVYELTAHPSGAVYASVSTDYGAGVYRSRNAGGSWQQYDSGLINRVVISFCIDGEGDLLAGTFGLGVMKARP
jgi:hypothetical protein